MTDSLPDIPEAEQQKDPPLTKPQPHPSTPAKEEEVEEPVIHTDCVVFAKFKVGTEFKFCLNGIEGCANPVQSLDSLNLLFNS